MDNKVNIGRGDYHAPLNQGFLREPVSTNDVAHCYRLFLGRSAENGRVIADKVGQSRAQVIRAFLGSDEVAALFRKIPDREAGNGLALQPPDPDVSAWAIAFLDLPYRLAEAAQRAASSLELLSVCLRAPSVGDAMEQAIGEDALMQMAEAGIAAVRSLAENLVAQSGVFDLAFYIGHLPSEEEAPRTLDEAIAHYLDVGAAAGMDPGPLFDTRCYLRQRPDVGAAGINPLVHYLTIGGNEAADPHPLFDSGWYSAMVPDVAASGLNPLVHFIDRGGRDGDDPCPLFRSRWYLDTYPAARDGRTNPLAHFLVAGGETDPNPLFSCHWYARRHADAVPEGVNPLVHYMTDGIAAGLLPNPVFEASWYLRRYPSAAAAGMNALGHYLRYGSDADLDPGPDFDTAWYRDQHVAELGGMLPLEHYLKLGMMLGFAGSDPAEPYRLQLEFERRRATLETPELLRHIDVMIRPVHFVVFAEHGTPRGSVLARSIGWQIYRDVTVFGPDERAALIERLAGDDNAVLFWLGDDVLHPHALYHFASAFNADPDVDLVYADEDATGDDGERVNPFYKPDWSPDTLETFNYIGTAAACRADLARAVFTEARSSYDLVLRATERSQRVGHVRQVVVQTNARFDTDAIAMADDIRALEGRLERTGRSGRVVPLLQGKRCYRMATPLGSTGSVSVIIPLSGNIVAADGRTPDRLVTLVSDIVATSRPSQPEIIVVHDAGLGDEDLSRLVALGCKLVEADAAIMDPARKLHLGAMIASADHLLLLGDDIEPVTGDWIERMQLHFLKPHVGVVGAKLLSSDRQVLHGGIVIDAGDPHHMDRHEAKGAEDYFFGGAVARNFSAVTGRCMMTPASLYRAVGGFGEDRDVGYSDVDYCFKVRELGYSVVYEPGAELRQVKPHSRAMIPDLEKTACFHTRWQDLAMWDPFYNEDRLTVTPPTFAVRFNKRF